KPVENVAGREKHEYVVKQGDSLWEIARRYNVSLAEIRTWNGLGYSRLIKPGQSLNIWLLPGGNQSSVAAQPAAVLAQAAPPPVNDSQPARSGEITHTVASGETLWDIAQSYNVSIGDIKRWNGKRSNLIHPGDALKIMPK
ncbi:MAG: LysM peptidoglycan-binding domain-containing protein, partial [Calditrichaeota bacterium]|nr:LysM peptidoglycan-binding domain-containing protein [Calditrichota bacterium]